jgi:hypothetical protein
MENSWSFGQTWNDALELGRPARELKVRKNMWAGECGGAFIDRWLKMNAVAPTNPPNPRSQRKFEAGSTMEWILSTVLRRAGILKETQTWLRYQYPGLLEVTGKLDFLAGGTPDWEKAKKEVLGMELPDFFGRAMAQIVEHLSESYPNGLKEIILECKSCSSFMYEKYEKFGADKRHQAQIYHYLKAKNMDEGHVVYISRDDLRLLELGLFNPNPEVEAFYKGDIEKMTHYIEANEKPPLEEEVIFDDVQFRFSQNFKVGYSNYISMLYGLENQFAYETKWKKTVGKWNRVFSRCVNGDKMTKLNLEVLDEIKKMFPHVDELVDLAKMSDAKLESEEEE